MRAIQAACQISSRTASISVRMSASANAIDWFSMTGRPNASRSPAYSSAYSYAARAMPSAWAPTVGRLTSKVAIAACPLALVPSRARASRASSFSLPPSRQCPGTRTPSRNTSAVCEARRPSFLKVRLAARPFVAGGTMNAAWPRAPRAGSTEATTTWTPAIPPLVIQAFWPVSTHSSRASS